MATSAMTKLSSQSPVFNPNRILTRDQSTSPLPPPPSAYGSRSRSTSPYANNNNNNNNSGGRVGRVGSVGSVGATGGNSFNTPSSGARQQQGGRGRMIYPTKPNNTHSNAIAKHSFEFNG
jgi:hypothetical protein